MSPPPSTFLTFCMHKKHMQKGLLYKLRFYKPKPKEDLLIDMYYYVCNYIKYNVIITLSPTPDV